MDTVRALVFATAVPRAALDVQAAQANAPHLLLKAAHDGRAVFAWAVDDVEKVALDEHGRCLVELGPLPLVDGRNEGHVDLCDLEAVAREPFAFRRTPVGSIADAEERLATGVGQTGA